LSGKIWLDLRFLRLRVLKTCRWCFLVSSGIVLSLISSVRSDSSNPSCECHKSFLDSCERSFVRTYQLCLFLLNFAS
jgi:hypothetical protein